MMRAAALAARLLPLLGRFGRDEAGGILVLFAVAMGTIFGFMALVWDIGRTMSLATDLQSFADHVALAAAAELDGQPGARARATAMVSDLLEDRQSFAAGERTLTGADVETPLSFFRSLPAADRDPLTDAALGDGDASYLQVVLRPRTVTNLFAGLVNALTGSTIADPVVSAQAVAGRARFACGITPVMFCAPSGGGYEVQPGRMLRLATLGSWQEGELGLLDQNFTDATPCGAGGALNPSADFYRCALAIRTPVTRCFAQGGVTIDSARRTGAVAAGFNSRFDIYLANLVARVNDQAFAPAPNVIKGIGPSGAGPCIDNLATARRFSDLPFPETSIAPLRDPCFGLGSCQVAGTAGNGANNLLQAIYWFINHGFRPRPAADSRFDLYQAELAAPPTPARLLEAPRPETGRPICFANGAGTPAGPDRRLITAAAVDCTSLPLNGELAEVPVMKFVQLFMTEPAEQAGDVTTLWLEEVAEVTPNTDSLEEGQVHDVVQLYR